MTKYFIGLLIVITIGSCKGKGLILDQKLHQQNCPQNGHCTFEVLSDTVLQIKKDAYGQSYQELQPQSGKLLLKFQYERVGEPEVQDGHYREIIWISIDKEVEQLNLTDSDLSQANVAFSRICNCRGATGIYKIENGFLHIRNRSGNFEMDLEIQTTEVPQVIKRIQESFKL